MNGVKPVNPATPGMPGDYPGILYSRVIYDGRVPINLVMSVDKVLQERKGDVLRIHDLTAQAKRTLKTINRKG